MLSVAGRFDCVMPVLATIACCLVEAWAVAWPGPCLIKALLVARHRRRLGCCAVAASWWSPWPSDHRLSLTHAHARGLLGRADLERSKNAECTHALAVHDLQPDFSSSATAVAQTQPPTRTQLLLRRTGSRARAPAAMPFDLISGRFVPGG
eukprot:365327-Chlamydomonas_euryale.AAC.6